MSSEQSLLKALDAAGIVWTLHEHEAVFTVEQSGKLHATIPGSVTPLAAFNDTTGTMKFVIDGRLAAAECFNVHPLRNTATISLCGSGLLSFLTGTGYAPVVIAVPASP